jgi:hypothetical protein
LCIAWERQKLNCLQISLGFSVILWSFCSPNGFRLPQIDSEFSCDLLSFVNCQSLRDLVNLHNCRLESPSMDRKSKVGGPKPKTVAVSFTFRCFYLFSLFSRPSNVHLICDSRR